MTAHLNEVLARVEELVRRTPETIQGHELPTVTAEATAYDGRVRVVMSGGEVSGVDLHPSALRLEPAVLGRHLTTAFNEAQRRHTEALGRTMAGQDVDFDALGGQIRVLREDANRALTDCLTGITETLTQGRRS